MAELLAAWLTVVGIEVVGGGAVVGVLDDEGLVVAIYVAIMYNTYMSIIKQ